MPPICRDKIRVNPVTHVDEEAVVLDHRLDATRAGPARAYESIIRLRHVQARTGCRAVSQHWVQLRKRGHQDSGSTWQRQWCCLWLWRWRRVKQRLAGTQRCDSLASLFAPLPYLGLRPALAPCQSADSASTTHRPPWHWHGQFLPASRLPLPSLLLSVDSPLLEVPPHETTRPTLSLVRVAFRSAISASSDAILCSNSCVLMTSSPSSA